MTDSRRIHSCIPISPHLARTKSVKKGTKFAPIAPTLFGENVQPSGVQRPLMNKDQMQAQVQGQDKGVSLETMIAVGVFGWLALGVVMMGLGIW